jgi:hypothetical protein
MADQSFPDATETAFVPWSYLWQKVSANPSAIKGHARLMAIVMI